MKFALLLVATLALVNLSYAAYPVGYAESRNAHGLHRSDSYYRGLLRNLGEGQELDQDYSEEEEFKADSTYSGYRPTTQAPSTTAAYQWQWRPCYDEQECYRQYVREFYRYHAYHDALQRGATPTTTRAPPPTRPPKLQLRSGDDVHFGEGINWSIYKTGEGLTRVGTRDGEVVVRVVRPNYSYERPETRRKAIHPYEDIKTRSGGNRRPAATTETPTTARPAPASYQWQWQPCYNEQDCYRQYVNEYYRFYANNQ